MLKRYLIILLMFTAYTIMLGHSIIPHHHHHNNHNELTEHHNTEHHHEDKHLDGEHHHSGIGHLFSHLIHLDDAFTTTVTQSVSNTYSKLIFSFVSILTNNFSFENLHVSALFYVLLPEQLIYISPHSLSAGLRAPPITLK